MLTARCIVNRDSPPMLRYRMLFVGWLALAITAASRDQQVLAQAPDPHQIFEQRCGGCHSPHAGDFARNYLVRSQGKMLTRKSSRELRGFLNSGHGKLSPVEIDVLVVQFGRPVSGQMPRLSRSCRRTCETPVDPAGRHADRPIYRPRHRGVPAKSRPVATRRSGKNDRCP